MKEALLESSAKKIYVCNLFTKQGTENFKVSDFVKEVEKYWSDITGVSLEQFQKPFFQKFIWKKEYPNPNEYFGVLRIRANKQLILFRKILGWLEGLKVVGRVVQW